MILVSRDSRNRPPGFEARSARWTSSFEKARSTDPTTTAAEFWGKVRKELSEDVGHLVRVFHGKCAFCEARMSHIHRPHVEHYRPKGRREFEQLMFVWENWLVSCGRCNESKWAHFPICGQEPCLLDPTSDDPSTHMDFLNGTVLARTERGEVTVRLLGLNRGPLEDEREQWLMQVNALLLLALHGLEEAKILLRWSLQADAPFSACTTAYLHERAPLLKPAEPRQVHPDLRERVRALVKLNAKEAAELF